MKEKSTMENKSLVERPVIVENDHLVYLDRLRDSGVTNMYGATPYLRKKFPDLSNEQATQILSYWMRSFGKLGR